MNLYLMNFKISSFLLINNKENKFWLNQIQIVKMNDLIYFLSCF